MKVNFKQPLPFRDFQPIVDNIVQEIETMMPDTIDGVIIKSWIDFYAYTALTELAIITEFTVGGIAAGNIPVCANQTLQFRITVTPEYLNATGIESIRRNVRYCIMNNLLHIIHLAKTGEILTDASGELRNLI
jgi:hypothetical protein